MRTFRKESIWGCFDTYALIAVAFINVLIWRVMIVGLMYGEVFENSWYNIALVLFVLPAVFLYALWHFSHSICYVVIDNDTLIFKNAIFGFESRYPIRDIKRCTAHHERNGKSIWIHRDGRIRRFRFVNMVPDKEIYDIVTIIKSYNTNTTEYLGHVEVK